jgi:hypothetical protein
MPPCHRRQRYARRGVAPTASLPPWAHEPHTRLGAHRPPAPPAPCPNPKPAIGVDLHRGHTTVTEPRIAHNDAIASFAAALRPPPTRPRQRPPRRPRCPRSRCGRRHPTDHAIASHCARRCPLLRFLTFDKPETLSDNDVRLTAINHPPTDQSQEPPMLNFSRHRWLQLIGAAGWSPAPGLSRSPPTATRAAPRTTAIHCQTPLRRTLVASGPSGAVRNASSTTKGG